ncbi:MAG: hypothetical protein JSV55_03510 [Deltaproteobacteria bacterium]|nr:MAG: hypothetical protein JSV55_03510 [Deltaproteobacteria bacterium]
MKRYMFILILFLIGIPGCYTGTPTRPAKDMNLIPDSSGVSGKQTRTRISQHAQVFRLTNLDAPQGFKMLDVKSDDWSFYLVRFNLQSMPLEREEVKSTYFVVKFNVKQPSSFSSGTVIIDRLFPSSTSRQVYLFESDLKAGGQARITAEAGYGWLRKEKKEEKEAREETEKGALSEKTTVTEEEITLIKREGLDEAGERIEGITSTETKRSKVSETEKYDREAAEETYLRTLEKITDVNLNFAAGGNAYLEASAGFSMSYKKEKREPLITATGTLSDTAVWLDRRPFQNGDRFFSVIIKVPRATTEMTDYFVREFRKSKFADLERLVALHKLQLDRHKVVLRFAKDEYLKGVFSEQEAEVIQLIRDEIDQLEKKVAASRQKLSESSPNEAIGGYLHDHLKLLYKFESFTETYEEALKQELTLKKGGADTAARQFAVSYQLNQINRHRKDIQLLLAKNEIDLYQITCEAEAQLDVNGARLTHSQDAITLLAPERVLSLVVE